MIFSESIQILIVEILSLTVLLSMLTFKENNKHNKLNFFSSIVKEHREVKKAFYIFLDDGKITLAHEVVFNFYEYLSSLVLNSEIDTSLVYNYFKRKFGQAYVLSKTSPLFEKYDINKFCPNLVRFFYLVGFEEITNNSD